MTDPTPEELAARDIAELEAAAPEPSLRETLPKVCLHPEWWCPPVMQARPSLRRLDPAYDAYRKVDRPYRRAFGRAGAGGGRRHQMRGAHALAYITMKEQS